MDYRTCKLSPRDRMKCAGLALAAAALIAYLFYASPAALLLFPLIFCFLLKRQRRQQTAKLQETLAGQFIDALRSSSAALLAGFSMENAWKEAQREIGALYGEDSHMYRELDEMNRSVALNEPLEELLEGFAERTGNADIATFSEVFAFAKRSGGNFVTIMEATSGHMRARFETEREIRVQLASRKMEQKVMNAVPLFILAYLKMTSMDFLDVLYHNAFGALFMTTALAAYAGALVLAERILDIRM